MLRIILTVIVLSSALLDIESATGQTRQAEYFVVRNDGGRPITVSLKAKGGRSPDKKWQKGVRIEGGGAEQKIRLRGFEPFDISIRDEDGTSYVVKDAYLCSAMIQCRNQPRPWRPLFANVTARIWNKVDEAGKSTDVDTGHFATFNSDIANNHVRIVFRPPAE